MKTVDLTFQSIIFSLLILIIPITISYFLKIHFIKKILLSAVRMVAQLLLVGLYLKYIFDFNHPAINILYLFIMTAAASFSVIKSSSLNLRKFFVICFFSISTSALIIVFYFNFFIINLDNLFAAKYFIPIGGMLLGNSLRGNIIALTHFYQQIKEQEESYFYMLSLGAGKFQALLPYIRQSLKNSIAPTMATMATIGLVSLPGMMTGQILGGSSPMTAIKYQIGIMAAILTNNSLSVLLQIILSIRISFNSYDLLDPKVFKK